MNNRQIIPNGLEKFHSFINWRYDGTDKVPCDIHGRKIDAHDTTKWLSADAASLSEYPVAFVVFRQSGIFFVDLDHALVNGAWSPMALEVLSMFPGAAVEVSASGEGLHIIGRGSHAIEPDHKTKDKAHPGLELYTDSRFIALTGTSKAGSALVDCSAALPGLVRRFGLVRDHSAAPALLGPRDSRYTGPEDDAALLAIMERSKGGIESQMDGMPRAWDLFTGNAAVLAQKYPQPGRADKCPFDRSSADAALMYHLSFYTGRDIERMERLFKASALYRPGHYDGKFRYRLENILSAGVMHNPRVYDVQKPPMNPTLALTRPPRDFNALLTYDDIEKLNLPEPKFLIHDFLPAGTYILAGPPKQGKSFMALNLAAAVATDQYFLGKRAERGHVLYFGLEDHRRRILDRWRKVCRLTMASPNSLPVKFATMEDEVENMDRGFLADLEYSLERDPLIRLVIIDTLAPVRFISNRNEGVYDYDRRCIDPLTKITSKYPKLTILVNHHTKKRGNIEDPMELISGSTGLTAATDGNFVMMYSSEAQSTVLYGRTRECEPVEMAIKLVDGIWENLGDPTIAGMHTSRKAIMDIIMNAPMPLKKKEIADLMDCSYENTRRLLNKITADGYLRITNGCYYPTNKP